MLTLALSRCSGARPTAGWRSPTRQRPARLSRPFHLDDAASFYYSPAATAASLWLMARFVGSPFGAALRGARDQPRRMGALGTMLADPLDHLRVRRLLGRGVGLLFVYYPTIHSSHLAVAHQFRRGPAGGDRRRLGTLAGPVSAPRSSCSSRITSRRTSSAGTRCSACFRADRGVHADGVVPG